MNREPDFELSADMRLLELQRSALGLSAPERPAWETRLSTEPSFGTDAPAEIPRSTAVLAVELSAHPDREVIPGTVITFSLSIANEGTVEAADVSVSVPRPAAAAYRHGSFVRDGRAMSDDDAEAFFGSGVSISNLASGSRATFIWKLGVALGVKPLVVLPQVAAGTGAVIGARPLSISRKRDTATAFAGEVARADQSYFEAKPLIAVDIPADDLPIYELDEEERLVYEAAESALSTAAPQAVPEIEPEPEPEPIVEAAAEQSAPAREAVVLYAAFTPATLAFFERIFNASKPPTILQHCIFGSALACAQDGTAHDAAALKVHLAAQSQVLHRISLHEKLGKKAPIAEYAGELLAELDAFAAAPVGVAPSLDPTGLTLATELAEPTLNVVRKISEERARWDFVKARQLTLALQAQTVTHADEARRAAVENALRAYAQASMTVLQKLFVRIRIDRTTGLLFQTEPALDASARVLLAALTDAMPR